MPTKFEKNLEILFLKHPSLYIPKWKKEGSDQNNSKVGGGLKFSKFVSADM